MTAVASIAIRRQEAETLNQLLGGLVGATFLSAQPSTGGEVQLEFRTADGVAERTWWLATCATRWVLVADNLLVRDSDEDALSSFERLRDVEVVQAVCRWSDHALSIAFASGARFILLTIKPRWVRPRQEIPLWELHPPQGPVVYVQPNGYVDHVPRGLSDDAARAKGFLRA